MQKSLFFCQNTYFLRKNNEKMTENIDEVNEKIERVHDKVFAAHSVLLDNQLRVVENKSTHYEQTQVQANLIENCHSQE